MNKILSSNFIPKIIFFDIDDTLSRNSIMAEHNKATLVALSKTDVKVVIATGRSKTMMTQEVLDLLKEDVVDAIICMNGQYSYYKGIDTQDKMISHYPLSEQQAQQIVTLCKEKEVVYKFESKNQIAWSENSLNYPRLKTIIDKDPNFIIDPEFYKKTDVYQSSVLLYDINSLDDDNKNHQKDESIYLMEDVDFASYNLKFVPWHIIGADILPVEASKARAIKDVCKHFALDVKDSMAFGDGMNDIEMFDLVGFAVAMGDGRDELKKHADYVTGTIEEHGIQYVLSELGIVDKS